MGLSEKGKVVLKDLINMGAALTVLKETDFVNDIALMDYIDLKIKFLQNIRLKF
jgi:hypothetical protein